MSKMPALVSGGHIETATKIIERQRKALEAIEAFGYANSGKGFSCARMASEALGKEVK